MPRDSHPAAAVVIAADGQQIPARFFGPDRAARGTVLIVPAMGVAQDLHAAAFDYRGIGYSRPPRLRKIGDLPKGVIEQWRRWCLNANHAAGAEGEWARTAYATVTTPIVSLAFTDDECMSLASIDSLHALDSGAPRTMKRVAPAAAGVGRIGHFGFFRGVFARALWPRLLATELT